MDAAAMDEAERLLTAASAKRRPGRFQLEAAIQSAHAARRHGGATDWPAIAALYDVLYALTDSKVVAVNRAVATAEAHGEAAGLALLEMAAAEGGLDALPILLGGARRTLRPRRPQRRSRRRLPPRDRPRIRPGDARLPDRAAGRAGVLADARLSCWAARNCDPVANPLEPPEPMPSIAPFSTPGRFWRGNLHTHSTLSDGGLAPEAVIAAYKTQRLRLPPTLRAFPRPLRLADRRHPRLPLQRLRHADWGRVHAMATNVGELWHILAVGLPLDFPPPRMGETGPELARRARDAGAFVAIAHPAWSQLTEDDGRTLEAAHAVEIYNHGCAVETDRGDGFYLLDRLCNLGRRLTAIATDDAHFNHGERDAFGGFVAVKAESLDPEALLAALKAGQFYASQGPRLHDVRVGRDEIVVETSPVQAVALLTGVSRALHVAGSHITRAAFDLAGAANKAWAEMGPDAWFRVVAIDAAGRRAWTNPIWPDALG